MNKKIVGVLIGTLLIAIVILPVSRTSTLTIYSLPPPKSVDMILEESIFRRSSVRDFSDESVSDEELSTI